MYCSPRHEAEAAEGGGGTAEGVHHDDKLPSPSRPRRDAGRPRRRRCGPRRPWGGGGSSGTWPGEPAAAVRPRPPWSVFLFEQLCTATWPKYRRLDASRIRYMLRSSSLLHQGRVCPRHHHPSRRIKNYELAGCEHGCFPNGL